MKRSRGKEVDDEIMALDMKEDGEKEIKLQRVNEVDGEIRAMDLKEEDGEKEILQQRLRELLLASEEFNLENVDEAEKIVIKLKDLKLAELRDNIPVAVPEDFKCPISKNLMTDPVVLSSGVTYDRPFIQDWIKDGNSFCPVSSQPSHATLIPNYLLDDMIKSWNVNPSLELPEYNPNPDDEVKEGDLQFLMESISSADTLEDQKFYALRLRQLIETNPSIRAEFGESRDNVAKLIDAISRADALSESRQIWYNDMVKKWYNDLPENEIDDIDDTLDKDLATLQDGLRENLIATITSVSIHSDNIKKCIAETPNAIQLLVNAMNYRGREELRTTAVVAIKTLCSLDSNKVLIGKADNIIQYLKEMFDVMDGLVLKEAADTILSLWSFLENTKPDFPDNMQDVDFSYNMEPDVKADVIKGSIQMTEDMYFVDDVLEFLAGLSIYDDAIEKMVRYDAVTYLFNVLRKNPSPHTKENCAVILHAICCQKDHHTLIEMRSEEKSRHTLSRLVEGGTPRAIIKVNGILERLKG